MTMPARTATARQFFGRHGTLSHWHPNFEFRPGQLAMAEAVEGALRDRKHLVVEAGTGTGKTLAYLVPAILSGRRVVITTGTKNLQEQLFYKDIPFLQKHLDRPLQVCYMKGRGNYACRQKIYDLEKETILTGLEESVDFQVIEEWEKTTQFGDRGEIKTLPEGSVAWAKIDARRDLCSGQKCQQFQRCFITQMHQRAHQSDIIIVNHHLFFADLALKEDDFGGILPAYHAVVFDEAHEAEEIAGQYFGVSISNYRFQDLARDIHSTARQKNFGSVELDRSLSLLDQRVMEFFQFLPQTDGRSSFAARAAFLHRHGEAYRDLLLALDLTASHFKLMKDPP
ncbi:MAG: ATP-dependent DNA helicase, partial [Bryobacteraceae bacterium]